MKHIKIIAVILIFSLAFSCSFFEKYEITGGTWDSRTYTNDFTGMELTVPENYTVLGKDELKKIYTSSLTNDFSGSTKYNIMGNPLFDMLIYGSDNRSTIFILLENVKKKFGSNATSEKYYELLSKSWNTVEGIEFSELSPETISIGGYEYFVGKTKLKFDGTETLRCVYIREIVDNVFMVINVTSYPEITDEMNNLIKDSENK